MLKGGFSQLVAGKKLNSHNMVYVQRKKKNQEMNILVSLYLKVTVWPAVLIQFKQAHCALCGVLQASQTSCPGDPLFNNYFSPSWKSITKTSTKPANILCNVFHFSKKWNWFFFLGNAYE